MSQSMTLFRFRHLVSHALQLQPILPVIEKHLVQALAKDNLTKLATNLGALALIKSTKKGGDRKVK